MAIFLIMDRNLAVRILSRIGSQVTKVHLAAALSIIQHHIRAYIFFLRVPPSNLTWPLNIQSVTPEFTLNLEKVIILEALNTVIGTYILVS